MKKGSFSKGLFIAGVSYLVLNELMKPVNKLLRNKLEKMKAENQALREKNLKTAEESMELLAEAKAEFEALKKSIENDTSLEDDKRYLDGLFRQLNDIVDQVENERG